MSILNFAKSVSALGNSQRISPNDSQNSAWTSPVLLWGSLVLLCGISAGCGGDEAAGQAKKEQPPALVRVAQMVKKPVSRRIEVVGNVTPVRTSVVASGANGVVQHFEADDGREIEKGLFVTEGTVLSKLRMVTSNLEIEEAEALLAERDEKLKAVKDTHPKELAHAQAMVERAQAVKNNAERKWERAQKLHEQGVANDSELEDALENWRAASQSLIAAEETLNQVKEGRAIEQAAASKTTQEKHIEWLKAEQQKRTTRAPFDGFIVEEHTYIGQWLSKGDPVVTMARIDEVDVMVHVDQADLPHIRLGQPARVTVKGAEQTEWTGHIEHIVPESDWQKGSRGFPVVVRIENKLVTVEATDSKGSSRQQKVPMLKAGMLARVTMEGPAVETLLVHKDALVRTTRGTKLYVFDPAEADAKLDPKEPVMGSVRRFDIKADLALSDGEMIGIRLAEDAPAGADETPLKPGQWVVTEGGERFAAPMEDNVNALGRIPDQNADNSED